MTPLWGAWTLGRSRRPDPDGAVGWRAIDGAGRRRDADDAAGFCILGRAGGGWMRG